MRLSSFLESAMHVPYESAIGQAIDLLSRGFSLPFALKRELVEQQVDVLALIARYSNTNHN